VDLVGAASDANDIGTVMSCCVFRSGYDGCMGWPATDRHGLAAAPAGLGFVQDFLNTQPTHPASSATPEPAADLLAELDGTQCWLDGALQRWSQETGVPQSRVLLTEADLDKLRSLRADLASLVRPADRARDVPLLPPASISVRVGTDGAALLEPRGKGSRRVTAIVLIETFTAQRLDNWRRLKLCSNDRCSVSFYDRSRNNSAVYHDSRVCGNAIYLRASRARKRQNELNTTQNPRDAETP
jgi:predicted RNA-binding Zn ribbon-like protein